MAKVIVLDDVLDAVHLVKRVLETAGHEVFGFTAEEDALGFIKENQVDLIDFYYANYFERIQLT